MSEMTRRFEVILTSFSSDKGNGQFKFKIKCMVVYNVSQRISARALKCSKLTRELSPIVCSIGFLSRMKSISRIGSQAFPGISLKRRTASEARGLNFKMTSKRRVISLIFVIKCLAYG